MPLSNLAARVIVAVVAIPLVIAAVVTGGVILALVLGIVSALAARELYGIAEHGGYTPLARTGTLMAFLLPLGVHYFREGRFVPPEIALGAVVIIALFALALFRRGAERHPLGAVAVTLLGVMYTAGFLSFAYALRYHNYIVTARAGSALVFYPFVLTWISDTAGFFVGRAFGRAKLMPSVSPGKTRAGALGALVFCMLASWAYAQWVLVFYPFVLTWISDTAGFFVGRAFGRAKLMPSVSPGKTRAGALGALLFCMLASWAYAHWVLVPFASLGLRTGTALALGAAIGVSVQIGDLVESLLKREGGVKDSSHLIPGHGGVLDRIDGMLFALPVTYFLFTFPHVLLFVNR